MSARARAGLTRGARWAAAALLLLAAGCSRVKDLAPVPDESDQAYRLGVSDQVRVLTFGEESLSDIFRVNDAGNIALPLLGPIRARGLTTEELSQNIAGELNRRGYIRDPSVSVEIVEYRPVFVLGEVNRPGQYPFQPGMTVLSVAAVAGGFTYRAVQDQAAVVRLVQGQPVEGKATPLTILRPGDVVTIYERRF
jgi:polysaccharide export outer membrane protein